jgi:hypothetical protein
METYFQAVHQQASYRGDGTIPDLEAYISERRDTSGCKPAFDLIEYAFDTELPEYVIEHPVMLALNQSANDLVSWSNVSATSSPPPTDTRVLKKRTLQDIFSYNVEQSRGETHNLMNVLMTHEGLSFQQAVDRIGEMCKQCIDTFVENQKRIPSWGDSIDRDVKLYVKSMEDWFPGSLHWSFMTKRYFGDEGGKIKATRIVDLLSRKA